MLLYAGLPLLPSRPPCTRRDRRSLPRVRLAGARTAHVLALGGLRGRRVPPRAAPGGPGAPWLGAPRSART
jgi:hypothetical protein